MKIGLQKIAKLTKKAANIILGINDELSKSPVPELLLRNAPPSEAEISLILSAIENAKRDLATLEKQVSGIAKKRQLLNRSKFIRVHQSILSPLRRLPADILAEIFIQAAYSKREIYSTPPWFISQVCHQWRLVALDLPLLWNCIDVRLDEDHKTYAFLQFLAMRLNRSRQAPLDIFVSTPLVGFQYIQHPIIGFLVHHAERWRSLHLQIAGRTLQAFGNIKGRLFRLQRLELSLTYSFPLDVIIDTFEFAPRLQEVTNWRPLPPSIKLVLPLAQLISFHDSLYNRELLESLLIQSTSLQRLHLIPEEFPMGILAIFPFPSVRLATVTSFTIDFVVANEVLAHVSLSREYLEGLTLPCVEHICLKNYPGEGLPALNSLITRSYASLRKLEFSSPREPFLAEQLISILYLCPQLTDLETMFPHVTVLRALIINVDQPTIVPSLRTLTLHASDDGLSLDDDFARVMTLLVASRCEPRNTAADEILQSLSVRLCFRDVIQCNLNHELFESMYRGLLNVRFPSSFLANRWGALVRELPCIPSYINSMGQQRQSLRSSFKSIQKPPASASILTQIFNDLSNYYIEDVSDIYRSSLHHILFHIVQTIKNKNLQDHAELAESWQQSATSILDKWNTHFLIPDLPNRRWAFQGLHSIVYIPMAHEMRQNVDSALKMIYGVRFYASKYTEAAKYDLPPAVFMQYWD